MELEYGTLFCHSGKFLGKLGAVSCFAGFCCVCGFVEQIVCPYVGVGVEACLQVASIMMGNRRRRSKTVLLKKIKLKIVCSLSALV
jgi:hypothetical protein